MHVLVSGGHASTLFGNGATSWSNFGAAGSTGIAFGGQGSTLFGNGATRWSNFGAPPSSNPPEIVPGHSVGSIFGGAAPPTAPSYRDPAFAVQPDFVRVPNQLPAPAPPPPSSPLPAGSQELLSAQRAEAIVVANSYDLVAVVDHPSIHGLLKRRVGNGRGLNGCSMHLLMKEG